jgi:hypothetical protein
MEMDMRRLPIWLWMDCVTCKVEQRKERKHREEQKRRVSGFKQASFLEGWNRLPSQWVEKRAEGRKEKMSLFKKGLIKRDPMPHNSTFATLPPGCRPKGRIILCVSNHNYAAAGGHSLRVDILQNGTRGREE